MVECVYVRVQHKPTPWKAEADFFHKKMGYALLTYRCSSSNGILVLSSKQMFKLNQVEQRQSRKFQCLLNACTINLTLEAFRCQH